ncbi:MAG: M55 family metallopeptidase [Anaerolineaceae bacterium]|nr:M55 family metallopeptidase [Anaerolineaceae bacterium]
MKIYISADIEGVTDVTHWDETNLDKPESKAACEQMTAEVAAVCEGALKAGAKDILVKDAHWLARNIDHHKLPREARLIRGWTEHPLSMLQELDKSFDAVMEVGYHARGGSGGSPLEHSNDPGYVHIRINDLYASEFLIFAYAAAWVGVPVPFVSGDQSLVDHVKSINPHITTVAVKQGIGEATLNLHPDVAIEHIRAEAEKSLQGDLKKCLVTLPEQFRVEIRFKNHTKAKHGGFYPGATQVDPFTVAYEAKDYFEVLRFFSFM